MENETNGFVMIDRLSGEPVACRLQMLWLSGRVLPVGANLTVRHYFVAEGPDPAEAIYSFGLPQDAALRRFQVQSEGLHVASQLMPTQQAEEKYEHALEKGHWATMAEAFREGMVNLVGGNLRPGQPVLVELELWAGVELRERSLRFRFPFTLAPKYHRQARAVKVGCGVGEMELPASFGRLILPRWLHQAEHLHAVGFQLELALAQPLAAVASPSHAIEVTRTQEEAVVRLATEGDLPNRDLVLEVTAQQPWEGVIGGTGNDGKGGFAILTPAVRFGTPPSRARRVVFLLDRSGSMSGPKIKQAKKALAACLAALRPQD